MMAFLALAWWKQKLSGIGAKAALVAGIVAAIGIGIAWLRHDARVDERNAQELRLSQERLRRLALLRKREQASEVVGRDEDRRLQQELSELERKNASLTDQLAKMRDRVVCYPKTVVRVLNR